MKCLFCAHKNTDVIETRIVDEGSSIRRRRVCSECKKRFTTYERVEEIPIIVIKRDNKRERFDRNKLRNGILKSVGKTTVSIDDVERIVRETESMVTQQEHSEISSTLIGAFVADQLKTLDKVAYIRFSSVFKRFVDVEEFEKELKRLL